MCEFWSKYHLPTGYSNLPKNHSETSCLLNKLDVLFEMPIYGTIAQESAQAGGQDQKSDPGDLNSDHPGGKLQLGNILQICGMFR